MDSKTISLKYGKGDMTFDLPRDQEFHTIRGEGYPPLPDVEAAYRQALDHPIDSPPLREVVKPGETVALLVSDITRTWQRNAETLITLIEYLNEAGIPDENITIVIAVGFHRGNTDEEFIEICGDKVCHRVRVVNHDALELDNMVYLGKTSRGTEVSVNRIVKDVDKVILTGGCIFHFMVGYGGGRKIIMPGISSVTTIQQCHMWAMGPEMGSGTNRLSESGRTKGNPSHEDMVEVAAFVKPDFMVNVAPNEEGELAGIFAGNWMTAWLEATRLVDKIFRVNIEARADIVIASAGGYPKDINIYQLTKTLDNASYAMKPGKVSIILAELSDIREPEAFFKYFEYGSKLALEKEVRDHFTIAGWAALKTMEYCDKGLFLVVTEKKNEELVKKANLVPVFGMEEALKIAYEKCGSKNPSISIMPQGANNFPTVV